MDIIFGNRKPLLKIIKANYAICYKVRKGLRKKSIKNNNEKTRQRGFDSR